MSLGNEGTRAYGGPVTKRGLRVLLFVQTGDARPKCVPCSYRDAFLFRTDPMFCACVPYPRWWLVECENAVAGRSLIRCTEDVAGFVVEAEGGTVCARGIHPGRIIARGGKS